MSVIPVVDVYLELFKSLEGQWIGMYSGHGFEIIKLEYSLEDDLVNSNYHTHKLTAKKLTGDVNVPEGQITFYCEQTIEKSEIVLPIPGRGQIADTGFINPRYIRGSLHSLLEDRSGFIFIWHDMGGIVFLRRSRNIERLELDSEEEMNYVYRLRDFQQTLSLQNVGYLQIGGKDSMTLDNIRSCTEKLVRDDDSTVECVICLTAMEKGSEYYKIKECNHEFHIFCIEKWLIRCGQCPLCRKNLKTL